MTEIRLSIQANGGAQWKLGKPRGTKWRMLQCAPPAGRTGTEVSLMTTLYYSVHTSYTVLHPTCHFGLVFFLMDFQEVPFIFFFLARAHSQSW